MVSVLDVARYFVQKEGTEGNITQLKLQKLCYYAQGFYLAIYQVPLFPEHFEAWKHGPVAKELRSSLVYKGNDVVLSSDLPLAVTIASDKVTDFLNKIWDKFGHYKAEMLIEMTHAEDPWAEAYSIGQNTRLSLSTMQAYFNKRKNELMEGEALNSCEDDMYRVFLKDGKTASVPSSQLEAFVEENYHLIEPRKIQTRRKRLVKANFHT
jgi:uncharacterized phage-associated protein